MIIVILYVSISRVASISLLTPKSRMIYVNLAFPGFYCSYV